jgi:hypothetical protein
VEIVSNVQNPPVEIMSAIVNVKLVHKEHVVLMPSSIHYIPENPVLNLVHIALRRNLGGQNHNTSVELRPHTRRLTDTKKKRKKRAMTTTTGEDMDVPAREQEVSRTLPGLFVNGKAIFPLRLEMAQSRVFNHNLNLHGNF